MYRFVSDCGCASEGQKRVLNPLELEFTDCSKLCKCWEPPLGPLQGHQALNTEKSL